MDASPSLARSPEVVAPVRELFALLEQGLGSFRHSVAKHPVAKGLRADSPSAAARVLRSIDLDLARAETAAWAIQRFPLFSEEALQAARMLEVKTTVRASAGGRFDREEEREVRGRLGVPVFGTASLAQHRAGTDPYCERRGEVTRSNSMTSDPRPLVFRYSYYFGGRMSYIESAAVGFNEGIHIKLRAHVPQVPVHLLEQLEPIQHRFTDCTLVFEAEWEAAVEPPPAKDPLIIGTLDLPTGALHFLLAAYDLTQGEAYVSREFVTGP